MRNLAARAAMMAKTESVPYDSQIEYLESVSNGNCYINLNRYDIFNYPISAKFTLNETLGLHNNIICGARQLAFTNETSIFVGDGAKAIIARNSTSSGNGTAVSEYPILTDGATVEFYLNFKNYEYYLKVNGTSVATSFSSTGGLTHCSYLPITLFKLNGTSWALGSIKLYRFASGDIIDLIPVRVGQVGYMYDKVSGQLFGNSGTGSFVLGPDV